MTKERVRGGGESIIKGYNQYYINVGIKIVLLVKMC